MRSKKSEPSSSPLPPVLVRKGSQRLAPSPPDSRGTENICTKCGQRSPAQRAYCSFCGEVMLRGGSVRLRRFVSTPELPTFSQQEPPKLASSSNISSELLTPPHQHPTTKNRSPRQRNRNATLPTKKFQWKTQEWENRARNGSMRLTDTHFSPPHPPTVPHPAHHNHHPTPPHPPNVPHPAHHPMPHQPTTCPSEPKSRSWLHWRTEDKHTSPAPNTTLSASTGSIRTTHAKEPPSKGGMFSLWDDHKHAKPPPQPRHDTPVVNEHVDTTSTKKVKELLYEISSKEAFQERYKRLEHENPASHHPPKEKAKLSNHEKEKDHAKEKPKEHGKEDEHEKENSSNEAGEKEKEPEKHEPEKSMPADIKMRHKMRVGIRAALDISRARYPPEPNCILPKLEEQDYSVKNTFCLQSKEDSFVFREYAPKVFRALRNLFGYTDTEFVESVCKEDLADLGFSGKSGSFLYNTSDNKYVIKTLPRFETKFLRKILPDYYGHLISGRPSFLTKFVGMYRLKISVLETVSFIVMKNIFADSQRIDERYDLKGSTVGRKTLFSCVIDSAIAAVTLKDLDLVDRFRIKLGRDRKLAFMDTLRWDAEFLEKWEIIDYSLLLGVHFLTSKETIPVVTVSKTDLEMADGGIYATNDNLQPLRAIYYCGVIDILQPYTAKKALEHSMKALVYDKEGISVCSPNKYASRFLKFIANYIE